MSKRCDICGRHIKTGRKYCWEHRRTAQADRIRGEKVFNDATKSFINQPRRKIGGYILKLLLISTAISILITIISFTLSLERFGILMLMIWVLLIAVSGVISVVIIKIQEAKLEKKVLNRDSEYIQWVKEWVQDEKEGRDFIKSLLR